MNNLALLRDLVPGKQYIIMAPRTYLNKPQRCQFVGRKKQYCQLHGDYMYTALEFSGVKDSGRIGASFYVDPANITEVLEYVAPELKQEAE